MMKDHNRLCVLALFVLLAALVPGVAQTGGPTPAGLAQALPPPRQRPQSDVPTAAGSVWRIETVEAGYVGQHSSLALDSNGRPHISYYDFLNNDLKYAFKDGTDWHIETVDFMGYVGAYTSLALDSNDRPHITYCLCDNDACTTCDDLRYAWHDGADWHFETVDGEFADVGGYSSLALVDDQPHVSYYDFDNGDLKYAYKDAGGSPHILTLDGAGADVGRFTSLGVDGDHRYISYYDVTHEHLKYAHYDDVNGWTVETLDDTTYTGANTSLAVCKTYFPGAPRITYFSNGDLKYAHKYFFGNWAFAPLNDHSPGPTSLALNDLCQVHVSYFELYNGDLEFTYQDASGWHTETVDDQGDAWPYWTSLALDAAGRPYISYYDDSFGDNEFGLRFAYKVDVVYLPLLTKDFLELSIRLGQDNAERELVLQSGGDVDTEVVTAGSPPTQARRTGNGQALPSADGNQIPDSYAQFDAADEVILAGAPTTRLRIGVEYLDQGTDSFSIQYDALSGGPFGDGRFVNTTSVNKSDSGQFRTAVFDVCDAHFDNRDNGADFRIDDHADGPETIRRVTVALLPPGPAVIGVDACGANPWDTNPDSEAIQTCVDRACNGDTVLFTSGVDSPGYQGYRIDKTVFLVANTAKHDLTFTSTDPANHALLRATGDLLGPVVRLYARSRISNAGEIDDITLTHLDLHGGRDVRLCFGGDGLENGLDDNWGSWLPECSEAGDAWCRAVTLALDGLHAGDDPSQDYLGNPSSWSTGLVAEDLLLSQTECGTAFGMSGAACVIQNVTIETAGDHVHVAGCTPTENDEGVGDWADGITFLGPAHVISGNVVVDPSDVGIVFFGGKDTVISNNTVRASLGNYGMFAGIAIHPWGFGDVSGLQIIGNQVINQGDSTCGGIHAGLNIGPHMWGAACVGEAAPAAVGSLTTCLADPLPPLGALCTGGLPCQEWAYVAPGATLTLQDNHVSGAQVNYLIEGLDLAGTLVESGNTSAPPRMTCWEAAKTGCTVGGATDTWGTIDRVANHPTLPGWTVQRIHCAR